MAPQPDKSPDTSTTLTERLERGPLPLPIAIHYACDVAKELREFHKQGKTHGAVSGRSVELRGSHAVLLPPAGGWLPEFAWQSDIRGLGWVLQSLFPDVAPPEPPGSAPSGPRSQGASPSGMSFLGVWEAARRCTAGCLAADAGNANWTMQRVVSEFRLLELVARQWEKTAKEQAAADVPAPKLWRPAGSLRERQPSRLERVPPAPAPLPSTEVKDAVPLPALQFRTRRPLPKISPIRCPRCGAPYVHPSTPRTDFEETLELWHMPVLRCHRCSFRYFQVLGITVTKKAIE